MAKKMVCVFGTSRAKAQDAVYQQAYEIGKALAECGYSIANGGYGGAMFASAQGAAEQGAEVVGVTCSQFNSKANDYVSREIATNSLDERLDTLIRLGDAYVVLQGGTGTLLELAKVWEFKNKGFAGSQKPIILVGEFWKPLVDLMDNDDPGSSRHVKFADGAEELCLILKGLL